MYAQIWILSSDAVFARMLALELEMQRLNVLCTEAADGTQSAELVLLDLDSALPPPVDRYHYMIGFSRNSEGPGDDVRRLCSLVLRRPFEMKQLRDEVNSLLFEGGDHAWGTQGCSLLSVNGTVGLGGEALLSDGRKVKLSPKEHTVLSLLMEHRGTPVSRETISLEIGESSANKADVYVCFLRKKLETPDARLIVTVRGAGYCLL